MEIAVEPQRRPAPTRAPRRARPTASAPCRGRSLSPSWSMRSQVTVVSVGERHAAVGVDGVIAAGRAGASRRGNRPSVSAARAGVGGRPRRRALPRQPPAHAPRPRVSASRSAAPHRRRCRQRKARGDLGEPAQLVLGQRRAQRATRQANDELVAESVHHVVPSRHRRRRARASPDRDAAPRAGIGRARRRSPPRPRASAAPASVQYWTTWTGSAAPSSASARSSIDQCSRRSSTVSWGCDHSPSFEPLNVTS